MFKTTKQIETQHRKNMIAHVASDQQKTLTSNIINS